MKTNHETTTTNPRSIPSRSHAHDFEGVVFAASRGDNAAVDALATTFYGDLVLHALRALGPDQRADADDAVQDFFASLLEQKNRFLPGRGSAVSWLHGIVRAIAQTRRHAGGCHGE